MSLNTSSDGQAIFTKVEALKVAIGVILLAACSQIAIPLQPIPITLQTLAVFFIGLTYSPGSAVVTVGTYLILGAFGLPVFANYHGGLVWVFGKTGGYLFGFWVAVFIMATLQEKQQTRKFLPTFLICIVGQAIIDALGILWLSTYVGMKAALSFAILPFMWPRILKIALLNGILYTTGYFKKPNRG